MFLVRCLAQQTNSFRRTAGLQSASNSRRVLSEMIHTDQYRHLRVARVGVQDHHGAGLQLQTARHSLVVMLATGVVTVEADARPTLQMEVAVAAPIATLDLMQVGEKEKEKAAAKAARAVAPAAIGLGMSPKSAPNSGGRTKKRLTNTEVLGDHWVMRSP